MASDQRSKLAAYRCCALRGGLLLAPCAQTQFCHGMEVLVMDGSMFQDHHSRPAAPTRFAVAELFLVVTLAGKGSTAFDLRRAND